MYKLPWIISSALLCCSLSFAVDTAAPASSMPSATTTPAVTSSTSTTPTGVTTSTTVAPSATTPATTATTTITPTGVTVNANTPAPANQANGPVAGLPSQIEIQSFRTYDFEPSAAGSEKHSATSFPKSTTTYIYARMEGKNDLYNVNDATYRFNYRFYDSTGKLMGSYDTDFTVKKDWEYFYFYASWGFPEAGQWDVGNHKVEVYLGDTKIAETTFMITQ
jgi:hypothetical protein